MGIFPRGHTSLEIAQQSNHRIDGAAASHSDDPVISNPTSSSSWALRTAPTIIPPSKAALPSQPINLCHVTASSCVHPPRRPHVTTQHECTQAAMGYSKSKCPHQERVTQVPSGFTYHLPLEAVAYGGWYREAGAAVSHSERSFHNTQERSQQT